MNIWNFPDYLHSRGLYRKSMTYCMIRNIDLKIQHFSHPAMLPVHLNVQISLSQYGKLVLKLKARGSDVRLRAVSSGRTRLVCAYSRHDSGSPRERAWITRRPQDGSVHMQCSLPSSSYHAWSSLNHAHVCYRTLCHKIHFSLSGHYAWTFTNLATEMCPYNRVCLLLYTKRGKPGVKVILYWKFWHF